MRNLARHAEDALLFVAIALVFLLLVGVRSAHSYPLVVRFQNPPTGTLAYEEIEFTIAGWSLPVRRTTNCPVGMTCMVTIGAPSGTTIGPVTARARNGSSWSPVSLPIASYAVPTPTPCSFDTDHSKTLTSLDFAVFLADFENGYWNGADFAIFVSKFGKPLSCPAA